MAQPLPLSESRLAPILRPIHQFLSAEIAGGVMLLIGAVAALVWANSPWGDGYDHFWHTPLSIGFGTRTLAMSLAHWVNDGLMVIFFLLVGLEIKRELLIGELSTMRKAALPIAAAVGGMVVPAGIYLAFNYGKPGQSGWGIPMATDIAFAVGVLKLVGPRLPLAARVFLLAVAIVDDLGAVVVIAVFYTSKIDTQALAIGGAFLAGLMALNALRVHRPLPYVLLGIGLWAATLSSGIHATIAGVLLAFTIPATRQLEERPFVEFMRSQIDLFARDIAEVPDRITEHQRRAVHNMLIASQEVKAPLLRIEHLLLRPVTLLIMPIFAFANAGVDLRSGGMAALTDPVAIGVCLGLLVGKPLGVLVASWLAMMSGVATLPEGTTVRQIVGLSVLCGIGFTMSLFVGNLAFPTSEAALTATKLGIIAASAAAGLVGGVIMATSVRRPQA